MSVSCFGLIFQKSAPRIPWLLPSLYHDQINPAWRIGSRLKLHDLPRSLFIQKLLFVWSRSWKAAPSSGSIFSSQVREVVAAILPDFCHISWDIRRNLLWWICSLRSFSTRIYSGVMAFDFVHCHSVGSDSTQCQSWQAAVSTTRMFRICSGGTGRKEPASISKSPFAFLCWLNPVARLLSKISRFLPWLLSTLQFRPNSSKPLLFSSTVVHLFNPTGTSLVVKFVVLGRLDSMCHILVIGLELRWSRWHCAGFDIVRYLHFAKL